MIRQKIPEFRVETVEIDILTTSRNSLIFPPGTLTLDLKPFRSYIKRNINSRFYLCKETVELDILVTSWSGIIFPPDILGTRIKNAKLISLAIETFGIMC